MPGWGPGTLRPTRFSLTVSARRVPMLPAFKQIVVGRSAGPRWRLLLAWLVIVVGLALVPMSRRAAAEGAVLVDSGQALIHPVPPTIGNQFPGDVALGDLD